MMTDEEQYKDTLHWLPEAGIVNHLSSNVLEVVAHRHIQLQAIANRVDGASAGDTFIFYCELPRGSAPPPLPFF